MPSSKFPIRSVSSGDSRRERSDSMPLIVYVDFNTAMADPQERVAINTGVQPQLASQLHPGMTVILRDETLEVTATIEYDAEHHVWLGYPDWSTRRDLPFQAPVASRAVINADK